MTTPETMTEQQAEVILRSLLLPMDRKIGRWSMVIFLLGFLAVPGLFFALWLGFGFRWWSALLWSPVGITFLVPAAAIAIWWESLLARGALREFDRHFPPGSPQRAVALHVLPQLQTPNQAAEKLTQQLPETIIPRHQPVDVDGQLTQALSPANEPEPPPAPAESDVGPSPSGRYDFIPLELPPPVDESNELPGNRLEGG